MSEEKLSGAELVVRSLEYMNISTIFGLPGGAILPAYDPLYDSPIRHILARHEQGSGHMAEGYAQATGELGVVIATSGPGATNLITLQDAYRDKRDFSALMFVLIYCLNIIDASVDAHLTYYNLNDNLSLSLNVNEVSNTEIMNICL